MTGLTRRLFASMLGCLLAAASDLRAQQYTVDTYRQAQGLGNISVQDLAMDGAGFLWVATQNGLYRMLGSKFDRFGPEQGLAERSITEVFADSAGRIWAGTGNDLYLFDGASFHPFGAVPVPQYGPHHLFAESETRLLAISETRLVELTLGGGGASGTFRPFFSAAERSKWPELGAVSVVTRTATGTLWLGCGTALCSYRDGAVQVWGPGAGVEALNWLTLYADSHGALWAASKDRLLELPAGATRFLDRSAPGIDGRYFSWSPLLEDREGRLLAASVGGVRRWNGGAWQSVGEENGLTKSRITAIAVDRNGDPWIGTLTSGLLHWSGYEHWEGWTAAQGLPSSLIWSIAPQASGAWLVGTVLGPARLEPQTGTVTQLGGGPAWKYGQVGGITSDRNGNIWASTFTGAVLRIDPRTGRVLLIKDLAVFLRRLRVDGAGRIWLMSPDALDVIDDPAGTAVLRHVIPDHLPPGDNNQFLETAASSRSGADTEMWLLTASGLVRFDGAKWSLPTVTGLSFAAIVPREIASARDGSLWLTGMDETQRMAVWHLRQAGAGFFAERLALPSNSREFIPMGLLADRRGWLWLATDAGLMGWNGRSWRTFNQESGMIWNDTSRGILSEGSDGGVWVGTSNGLGHLFDVERAFDPAPLSVSILSLERGERRVQAGSVLPWERSVLRVHFAAPTAWNRSGLVFSYRMGGDDSPWITTSDEMAAFSNLTPGSYQFEVSAHSPETASTSPIASVRFTILPPWWRTNWAYCVYLACAGLVVWVVVWWRTRHLLRKRQELEEVVRARTQELEQSQETLRIQATHDALTGLLNRATILASLEQEMERARRNNTLLAVLMADVDHFKKVNDTYGHIAGDEVLRRFATDLGRSVRNYDHVGRYGGEEFLLVLSNLSEDDLEDRLIALHSRISNLGMLIEEHRFVVTCSVGVSILPRHDLATDANQLLSAADAALYRAKHAGRNRLIVAEERRRSGITAVRG